MKWVFQLFPRHREHREQILNTMRLRPNFYQQCSCLWSHFIVYPLEASFSERHNILISHEPSSLYLTPLIMQFLSLFPPLIPCADMEESELPLPINPFGTWAPLSSLVWNPPGNSSCGGWQRNRGPSPVRTTIPCHLKRNVTSEMNVWPHWSRSRWINSSWGPSFDPCLI